MYGLNPLPDPLQKIAPSHLNKNLYGFLPKLTNDIHIKVNCLVNEKHWGLQLCLHFFW
jgi:hypothetical protein